jgi:uncharacterized surface anchored protein
MTRTDVMASSRPQQADAASDGAISNRARLRRRISRRSLVALPVALALIAPAGAQAIETTTTTASSTAGYNSTPTTPTTTTTPSTTTTSTTTTSSSTSTSSTAPASGTGPSKESGSPTSKSSTPASSTAPSTTSSTTTPKQSTLPFTGLDLRWILLAGILLIAAGVAIRLTQRRQGHGTRR